MAAARPLTVGFVRQRIRRRAAKALTWKQGGHNLAFHAFQIATSNVADYDAAVKEIDGLVKLFRFTQIALQVVTRPARRRCADTA
jgi:hypothetical protein